MPIEKVSIDSKILKQTLWFVENTRNNLAVGVDIVYIVSRGDDDCILCFKQMGVHIQSVLDFSIPESICTSLEKLSLAVSSLGKDIDLFVGGEQLRLQSGKSQVSLSLFDDEIEVKEISLERVHSLDADKLAKFAILMDYERLFPNLLIRNGIAKWLINHCAYMTEIGPPELNVDIPVRYVKALGKIAQYGIEIGRDERDAMILCRNHCMFYTIKEDGVDYIEKISKFSTVDILEVIDLDFSFFKKMKVTELLWKNNKIYGYINGTSTAEMELECNVLEDFELNSIVPNLPGTDCSSVEISHNDNTLLFKMSDWIYWLSKLRRK